MHGLSRVLLGALIVGLVVAGVAHAADRPVSRSLVGTAVEVGTADADGSAAEGGSLIPRRERGLWSDTFGGTGDDCFSAVQQTSDGGFILAGYTQSWGNGGYDGWVVKLDSSGNQVWSRTFGGTQSDYLMSIQQTSDDGYIVAGWEKSWGNGNADAWVIKLDSNGTKVWSNTFGGASGDYFYAVRQTGDGGYIAAGIEQSWGYGYTDGWVVKLDSNGTKSWSRIFGGSMGDQLLSLRLTADGGYVAAGRVGSWGNGGYDGWVLKLDSTGSKTWSSTFGGTEWDELDSVQQTADGGFIVAGKELSWGQGDYDGWVMKLDSTGTKTWSSTYGGTQYDWLESVQQTADGGFIVAGRESSWGMGGFDGWLLKLGSGGSTTWSRVFGGTAEDRLQSVQQTTDEGYIVAGAQESWGAGSLDGWVKRLDSSGNR